MEVAGVAFQSQTYGLSTYADRKDILYRHSAVQRHPVCSFQAAYTLPGASCAGSFSKGYAFAIS